MGSKVMVGMYLLGKERRFSFTYFLFPVLRLKVRGNLDEKQALVTLGTILGKNVKT